ncbi:AAA family ATPase [Arthrobacter sp. PAMC25284]|uniref:AAA family ATPase n=1 Tax=Arthrobacter sp. PAMC25284 TaxID=2861279 RepID=UPI001C632DFD|nr:AAA family ATPase [Arthrobacter sp. PAMC25284]QYF89705.1 AAA family ATPase [Arthrobacter sp. PAMC25284]
MSGWDPELEDLQEQMLLEMHERETSAQFDARSTEAPTVPQTTDDSAWAGINLDSVLDGTYKPAEATLMLRTDGVPLVYPGLVHSFNGESESMKSFVLQGEIAKEINAGHNVGLADFESDQATVVNRLMMLGADPEKIRRHLTYIRPDGPHNATPQDRAAWERLMQQKFSLFVIDGVTEAFAVYGVSTVDNDEVTAWGRMMPRQIADRTGAAVALVDHVTKSVEGRGRFAIGAQAKMSFLTGASYSVEVIEPGGVGMVGKISLRIGKDRPGMVRPHGGPFRKSDRTQEAAVAILDSSDRKTIRYTLVPPRDPADATGTGRTAETMDAVLEAIRDAPTPPSFRTLQAVVKGSADLLRRSIAELITSGQITTEPGPRSATLHRIAGPYSTDTLTHENAA